MDIITEGMAPRSVFLLMEGMAIRYRGLPDGGRQIMTFLIPGDLCDGHVFLVKAMDHSVGTITPVRVAPISRESMMDIISHHPRISAALWWSSMQEEAMLRGTHRLARTAGCARPDRLLAVRTALATCRGRVDERKHVPPSTDANGVGRHPRLDPGPCEPRPEGVSKTRFDRNGPQKYFTSWTSQVCNDVAAFNKDYLHLGGASEEVARYFDELESKERGVDASALSTGLSGRKQLS